MSELTDLFVADRIIKTKNAVKFEFKNPGIVSIIKFISHEFLNFKKYST